MHYYNGAIEVLRLIDICLPHLSFFGDFDDQSYPVLLQFNPSFNQVEIPTMNFIANALRHAY